MVKCSRFSSFKQSS